MNAQSAPILGFVTEYFGRQRSVKPAQFADNELIKPITPLKTYFLFGAYLNLPPNVAAVVTYTDGQQTMFRTGGLLTLPPGSYGLQYVDIRQQRTYLPDVRADTLDAWQVTLALDITWQVRTPLQIVTTNRPYQALINECRAAAINFIQSRNHDKLIPAREGTPLEDTEISEAILNQLRASPTLNGFHIYGIKVLERRGDPLRLDKIRESNVEQTKYQQALLVENEKLKLELQKLQQQVSLTQQRGEVAMQEARASQQVSKAQAESQADVSDILLRMRRQAIELENLSREQKFEQEKFLKGLDTISQFASMFTQLQMTPGLQRSMDDNSLDAMTRLMKAMLQALPANESGAPTTNVLPAVNLRSLDK